MRVERNSFSELAGQFVQRVIVYGHTMDLSPLEEGTREHAAQRLRRVRKP